MKLVRLLDLLHRLSGTVLTWYRDWQASYDQKKNDDDTATT